MPIADYHRIVFDFLETYRAEHPDANLTYLLRQKNNAGRPRNQYLFSGSEAYISLGLYLPVSNNNKTRTISFCIDYNTVADTLKSSTLYVVFDDQTLANRQGIYEQIVRQLGPGRFVEFRPKRYELTYKDPDWRVNLLTYLTEDRPVIDRVLQESGVFEEFHVPQQALEESIRIANQPVTPETMKDSVNYWVFQGSPVQFRIVKSLEDGALKTWRVTAHADRIKPGDKIILWVTGSEAGCYALAEVGSAVFTGSDEVEEQPYQLTGFAGQATQRVRITILHNLWDHPVRKEDVQNLPAFSGFKGGNQGTNFTATEDQYALIEQLSQRKSRRYWKYAPGVQAVRWDDDFRDGTMAIDFSNHNTGSLSQYATQADLDNALAVKPGSNETWNMMLFKDAAIGDVVFANRGRNTVVGIGIVSGPYKYKIDSSSPYDRHVRAVNWLTNAPWQYTAGQFSGNRNLFRVDTFSPTRVGLQILEEYVEQYPQYRSIFEKHGLLSPIQSESARETMPEPRPQHPKNIILYGPPGTGKTYSTIDLGVEIVDGRKDADHSVNKARFDQLRKEGQIEFVTFHQNYTYEDFVMGLKPDADGDELKFQRSYGIFYLLAKRARDNFDASKTNSEAFTKRPFQEVFDEFMKPLVEEGKEINVTMASGIRFVLYDLSERSISFRKPNGSTIHTLSIATLRSIYEGVQEIRPNGLKPYYRPLSDALAHIGQQTSPKVALKHYVLIIDEINRANMSRVFGELITLLEDDKRLGETNELTVTLPSGESFSVPPNLYLIGTMNTADKSLALLDIALRRRFEFVYTKPNASVLKLAVGLILDALNKAIRKQQKSADFLIGHAYFIGKDANQLTDVFNNRVIPLLMEYFNGNAKTVIEVLKQANVTAVQDEITDQITVSDSHVG